jgi:GPH family glycoside/pentoside/hexuronide:cation symporter
MAQKFGGAIGGAAVLWLLNAAGYITPGDNGLSAGLQPDSAISCLWLLMSFIPAAVSALSVFIVSFYPLTTVRVNEIVKKLKVQRGN